MTLHWWMHWFWVTLWFTIIRGVPLPLAIGTTGALTAEESSTTPKLSYAITEGEDTVSESVPSQDFTQSLSGQNYRVPKAIGITPTPPGVERLRQTDDPRSSDQSASINGSKTNRGNDERGRSSVLKLEDASSNDTSNGLNLNNDNGGNKTWVKKDSKVTWIFTGNKTSRVKIGEEKFTTEEYARNSSSDYGNDDLAVLPLHVPNPTRFKLVLNRTKFIPSTNLNGDKIFNKSDDVELGDDLVEPRPLATAASILQGVSESPRLSRARSAFPSDYQQDEHERRQENGFGNATSSAVDIAAVTGSCLATLVLIGTMGSLGFVMYRRRYLNPPQTLNSDKCSNPDSSGYIDDSTIRDNSEEMYSLDNDSFLNSLEAMTIQNYWTDSVKHTKFRGRGEDRRVDEL